MEKFRHVLLIDDDEIFIFLTRRMLQATGKVETISICRSAREGLDYLDRHINSSVSPDLVFLDLNMPEMDGWEFLDHYQQFLNQSALLPWLYILSSSIAADDASRAMKTRGVHGYFPKPLHSRGIKDLLEKANEEKSGKR